jgi:hypothetical protein
MPVNTHPNPSRRVGDIVRTPEGRLARVFNVFPQYKTGLEQVDVSYLNTDGEAALSRKCASPLG